MLVATPAVKGAQHCVYCGVKIKPIRRFGFRRHENGVPMWKHIADYSWQKWHNRRECMAEQIAEHTKDVKKLVTLTQELSGQLTQIAAVDPDQIAQAQTRLKKIEQELNGP